MIDQIKLEEDEYHDTATMSAIATHCQNLYIEYDSAYRKRKLDEINEGRKRYDTDRIAKNFPWEGCSNKSMSLTAIAVDNLEPRIFNKLVSEDDFIQVTPTGAEDVDLAKEVKEFLQWACHNNMHIKKAVKPIVHDLLMDGTKHVIPMWQEKEIVIKSRGTVPIFTDLQGNRVKPPAGFMQGGNPQELMAQLMQMGIMPGGSEEGVREKTELDFKVHLEALKIEDCYFPDHNDNWDDQPFLRKIYPKLGDLVELQKKGVYKDIDNSMVKGVKRQETEDEQRKAVQYSDYGQECELIECYLIWKGEWRLATFSLDANWKEVRNQPISDIYWHSRKPIKRFRIYPKSNESMGTGVPKKTIHFDTGINDLYNQMIDCGTVTNSPFFFYNSNSTGITSNKKFKLQPGYGNAIPKDANVTFPNLADKSGAYINFINLLLTFFERTLSLMDYSAGTRSSTAGQGGDTASGMNMILQEGNIKHNYTGEGLQDDFSELLTDCLSLYAQNIPMSAKIRIFKGNEWVFKPVNVQALQGRYDLRVDVSDASSNSMTNRNDAITLMNITKGMPWINQVENTQDLYRAFGKKDVDKYVSQEFAMIMQALTAVPELKQQVMQIVQQGMQQKEAQDRQSQVRLQAENNIERQQIEREVEAPYENKKIVDRANEGFKRKMIGRVVEQVGGLDNN